MLHLQWEKLAITASIYYGANRIRMGLQLEVASKL